MRAAFDWLFRNRKTGRITIGQWPNVALWVYIGAAILRNLVTNGATHNTMSWIASIALVIWAGDELLRGVNPFRRAVGAVVLVGLFLP